MIAGFRDTFIRFFDFIGNIGLYEVGQGLAMFCIAFGILIIMAILTR